MNLSKIKTVGFIPNFSRQGSYPEFACKEDCPVVAFKPATQRMVVTSERVMTIHERNEAIHKQRMISKWKKTHRGYKAKLVETSIIN